VATRLGWGKGVGESTPRCGGVLLAREKEVAAMVLWPPRGDVVQRCGQRGARLIGVDKWYND
jgi:hypothetical protein